MSSLELAVRPRSNSIRQWVVTSAPKVAEGSSSRVHVLCRSPLPPWPLLTAVVALLRTSRARD